MICFPSMIHLRRPQLSIQRQGPFNLRLYFVRCLVILLRPHHLQIVRLITLCFMLILTSASIAPHGDLLGDDDAASTTPPLHDQSAEIGNAKNHLKSTNQSLEATRNESASIQQTLATQASQLSALQTQLSSAKAAYETETKLLAAFKERHSAQSAEIQKAREDLIRAESDLSAIRVEKSEIEGSFLRDKEDIRELNRKMNEVGQQIDALKTDIEKAKKDAKQQKGLLAIAKKQLSLKEAEKAKAEKEQEGALADLTTVTKEREEAEADLAKEGTAIEPKAVERATDSVAFTAGQQPLPHLQPPHAGPEPQCPHWPLRCIQWQYPYTRIREEVLHHCQKSVKRLMGLQMIGQMSDHAGLKIAGSGSQFTHRFDAAVEQEQFGGQSRIRHIHRFGRTDYAAQVK